MPIPRIEACQKARSGRDPSDWGDRFAAAGVSLPPKDFGPDLRATDGRHPDGDLFELVETTRPELRPV